MADFLKRYKAKFTRDGRGEGVFSPHPPHRQVWLGLMKNKDSELKYFAINDMGSLKNVLINVTFHSFCSIQILRLCSNITPVTEALNTITTLWAFYQLSPRYLKNYWVSKYQWRFCKGFSAQHCLLEMQEKYKRSVNQVRFLGVLLTCLSKIFHCLSHALIIVKLNAYGYLLSALIHYGQLLFLFIVLWTVNKEAKERIHKALRKTFSSRHHKDLCLLT